MRLLTTFFQKVVNEEKYLSYLFLAPTMLILIMVSIFPLLYSLRTGFTNFTFGNPIVQYVGFDNFISIFHDRSFWNGLKLTGIFVFGTSTIAFLLGLGIALFLFRKIKGVGAGFIQTIILSPMTITPIVVAIIWLLLFMPDFSLVNYLLDVIGMEGPQWLLEPGWALIAVMIAYIWQWTPFFVLMLLAGLNAIPVQLIEAALVDGATELQLFRFIFAPLLRQIIFLTLIVRIMDAFRVFDQVYVMTAGGPGKSTQVLSFVTYLNGIPYRYMGYASAMSWIMVVILILLANIMIRVLRQVRA